MFRERGNEFVYLLRGLLPVLVSELYAHEGFDVVIYTFSTWVTSPTMFSIFLKTELFEPLASRSRSHWGSEPRVSLPEGGQMRNVQDLHHQRRPLKMDL